MVLFREGSVPITSSVAAWRTKPVGNPYPRRPSRSLLACVRYRAVPTALNTAVLFEWKLYYSRRKANELIGLLSYIQELSSGELLPPSGEPESWFLLIIHSASQSATPSASHSFDIIIISLLCVRQGDTSAKIIKEFICLYLLIHLLCPIFILKY